MGKNSVAPHQLVLSKLQAERIENIKAVQNRITTSGTQNLELLGVAKYIKDLQPDDPQVASPEPLNYINNLQTDGPQVASSESLNKKLNILVMIEDIRPYNKKAAETKGDSATSSSRGVDEESKSKSLEERASPDAQISRHIEALEDNKTELKKVYNGDSENLEPWVREYLKDKLDSLKKDSLASSGKENDNFINTLHIPAMLRLFGATNTRLDAIEMGNAGRIDVVPHGSHVTLANTVGGEEQVLARTTQSIQDLSNSRVKTKLDDDKGKFGVTLKAETYLTTYVSDVPIMGRDVGVIDYMRQAIKALNKRASNEEYIYSNIAIQSGFALFEDYSLNEARHMLDKINGKTEDVLKQLSNNENGEARAILLQAVNKDYNDSFKKRAFHHYLSNNMVNSMMVATLVGIVTLATFSGAPLVYLAAVAGTLLLGQITANIYLKRPMGEPSLPSLRQTLFASAVVFTAVLMGLAIGIPAVTLPFSLPLLAIATLTAGATALMLVAWDYRAKRMPANANNTYFAALQSLNVGLNFDIHDMGCQEGKDRTGAVLMMREALMTFYAKNQRMPDMSDRNYLITVRFAALAITGIALGAMAVFGLPVTGPIFLAVASVGAAVAIGATVMQKAYPLPAQSDIKEMGAILSTVVMSGKDAEAAGRNTKGGVGMKHLDAYLPKALLTNLTKDANKAIKGYNEATKNFGIPGIESDVNAMKAMHISGGEVTTLELTSRVGQEDSNPDPSLSNNRSPGGSL